MITSHLCILMPRIKDISTIFCNAFKQYYPVHKQTQTVFLEVLPTDPVWGWGSPRVRATLSVSLLHLPLSSATFFRSRLSHLPSLYISAPIHSILVSQSPFCTLLLHPRSIYYSSPTHPCYKLNPNHVPVRDVAKHKQLFVVPTVVEMTGDLPSIRQLVTFAVDCCLIYIISLVRNKFGPV